jgi:sugar/nucleoside kinase (ribokinase family)
MEYIAAGYNMLTDVTFADGKQILNTPGGSWYAASGLACWRKSVVYVGTAGPDFDAFYGDWFKANGIECRVKKCLPETLKYELVYGENGIWTEQCSQGEDYEAMAKDIGRITPDMLAECAGPETKGIYIEASLSAKIADGFEEVKALVPQAVLMWEINGDDLRDPSCKAAIDARITQVDAFSMNYDEACAFFGTEDLETIVAELQTYGKPCFFRLGEKGSALVTQKAVTFAPAIGLEESVDPTGCGNCSTAAALIGIAEGLGSERTVWMANLAAAYCAKQTPPWPLADDAFREKMEQKLDEIISGSI